jgi:hypothetical protein
VSLLGLPDFFGILFFLSESQSRGAVLSPPRAALRAALDDPGTH